MSILTKVFGDANQKYLNNLFAEVGLINSQEEAVQKLTDQQLKDKTAEFKKLIAEGKDIDELIYEIFAVVREAAKRTLGQRHFDVQLIGGLVLHHGQVAEMRTGEGKTLTSTLAAYANALTGKGAHVITVNDYLAKRDAVWMGQVYDFLGLTVGVVAHDQAFLYDATKAKAEKDTVRDQGVEIEDTFLRIVTRKEAYQADITYGTNNEFGFDYLRDNMVQNLSDRVQRDLHYAIVDEVDSILIDEARTPLIISAPDVESTDQYMRFAQIVTELIENEDYNIDEKMRAATLTEVGISKVEKALGVDNVYTDAGIATVHHLEQALKAKTLFNRDEHYVVKEGEILIVDEFTGRLMQGRRYSEGLHQAIEAKEGVTVQRENRTMATITFQNYFRMYEKLAGMTGTAATEAEELMKIYDLEVTTIPTNKPMIRKDSTDKIYKTEAGKYRAVVREIKERHEKGQPILVGTISIEKNEYLTQLLEREGVPHNVLNAKQHEKEAMILAQAGAKGAVTIATNMAGRGVDIKLGGLPYDAANHQEVVDLGGLHVIGTERHEARRIDNQLRGRSGRQGDPGSSQFYVSLEDDLMRIFGSDRIKSVMNTLGLDEDTAIENGIISKSIESAQKKVEGHNFDIRKHLVEYDDIVNKQRENVYLLRTRILQIAEQQTPEETGEAFLQFKTLSEYILSQIKEEIIELISIHTQGSRPEWNLNEIKETLKTILPVRAEEFSKFDELAKTPGTDAVKDSLTDYILSLVNTRYEELSNYAKTNLIDLFPGRDPLAEIEKMVILRSIDLLWVEHLDTIAHLRSGIGLRGYGQRDPLVEYKRESFQLYSRLLAAIRKQIVYSIFKVSVAQKPTVAPAKTKQTSLKQVKEETSAFRGAEKRPEAQVIESKPKDESGHKIGRNDPCYCGSGKKYKKCHGQ